MLLLTSTNDRLQIITSAASAVNVHMLAGWTPRSGSDRTGSYLNTSIQCRHRPLWFCASSGGHAAQRRRPCTYATSTPRSLPMSLFSTPTARSSLQLCKTTLVAGRGLEYADQGGDSGPVISFAVNLF